MERLLKAPAATPDSAQAAQSLPNEFKLAALFAAGPVTRARCEHLPPKSFKPGRALNIEMAIESGHSVSRARLHYRHVNQAEAYTVEEMALKSGRYEQMIPGRYTDSQYPLQYFFELHDEKGAAWIHPGFGRDLMNQPYFVVLQT